jgi:hypothetical protein
MTRGLVPAVLVVTGVLSLGVAAQQGAPQSAGQAPNPNAPKVVEVQKLADNLYLFVGGGGNTGVFITATAASSSIRKIQVGASRFSTRSSQSPQNP